MIKAGMDEKQFEEWRQGWFDRIPKCSSFICCHELTSCCVDWLCPCGSIYSTYKSQKDPRECEYVSCMDCVEKYECKKPLNSSYTYKETLC